MVLLLNLCSQLAELSNTNANWLCHIIIFHFLLLFKIVPRLKLWSPNLIRVLHHLPHFFSRKHKHLSHLLTHHQIQQPMNSLYFPRCITQNMTNSSVPLDLRICVSQRTSTLVIQLSVIYSIGVVVKSEADIFHVVVVKLIKPIL